MKSIGYTLLLFSVLLSACQQKDNASGIDTKEVEEVNVPKSEKKDAETYKIEETNFRYDHIRKFTPEIHKGDSLIPIDSIFYQKVLSQIENFQLSGQGNYYLSKQHAIHGLQAVTVVLEWDICSQLVFLLILDDANKLLNYLYLTEWEGGCESTTKTKTVFLTDSTFRVEMKKTDNAGGEIDYIHEFQYEGLITTKAQVDTLKILLDKEYDE